MQTIGPRTPLIRHTLWRAKPIVRVWYAGLFDYDARLSVAWWVRGQRRAVFAMAKTRHPTKDAVAILKAIRASVVQKNKRPKKRMPRFPWQDRRFARSLDD